MHTESLNEQVQTLTFDELEKPLQIIAINLFSK